MKAVYYLKDLSMELLPVEKGDEDRKVAIEINENTSPLLKALAKHRNVVPVAEGQG